MRRSHLFTKKKKKNTTGSKLIDSETREAHSWRCFTSALLPLLTLTHPPHPRVPAPFSGSPIKAPQQQVSIIRPAVCSSDSSECGGLSGNELISGRQLLISLLSESRECPAAARNEPPGPDEQQNGDRVEMHHHHHRRHHRTVLNHWAAAWLCSSASPNSISDGTIRHHQAKVWTQPLVLTSSLSFS